MIASMVTNYKVFDVESHFLLIVRHLVEYMGFSSLLSFQKYEQDRKMWKKINRFLWELLDHLYD